MTTEELIKELTSKLKAEELLIEMHKKVTSLTNKIEKRETELEDTLQIILSSIDKIDKIEKDSDKVKTAITSFYIIAIHITNIINIDIHKCKH